MLPEPKGIECVRIVHGSADYREAVKLRQALLRQPLGLELSEPELESESGAIHLVARVSGRPAIFGTLQLLIPDADFRCKIRQVAVEPACQGSGVGRALMEAAESEALRLGARRVFCHARATVAGFYERLGFVPLGDPFEELGLTHFLMEKPLG